MRILPKSNSQKIKQLTLWLVACLSISSCEDKQENVSVFENKFELKHLHKTLIFQSPLLFDSVNYPLQYSKDGIEVLNSASKIAIDISIRQNMDLVNTFKGDKRENFSLIQDSFQQKMKINYENRDTVFHNNLIGYFDIDKSNIVYLERVLKSNVLDSDIKKYHLVSGRNMIYTSILLDSLRIDFKITFDSKVEETNKSKILSKILRTFKIL